MTARQERRHPHVPARETLAVVEAARAASAEIAEMRASGQPVCDVSHIVGAMRMATLRARQESLQPAETVAASSLAG